jgi:thiamine-monophosphate kinase
MTGEFDLISRYFAPLAGVGGLELKDDAAIYNLPPGKQLILTTDAIVEGVHFLPNERAGVIAQRLLRTNISDLAAKGARPSGYLLTLALPDARNEDWVSEFAEGLRVDQDKYGILLLGGDTVSTSGPIIASVTALGTVFSSGMVTRGGACVGDDLWVTGNIGDAGLGLLVAQGQVPQLAEKDKIWLSNRFRLPDPPASFGAEIGASGLVNAAADISDGLIADAGHISSASRVRFRINMASIPLSNPSKQAIRQGFWSLNQAVSAGDDYQIVFAASSLQREAIKKVADANSISVTIIGEAVVGEVGVEVLDVDGNPVPLEKTGFQHR